MAPNSPEHVDAPPISESVTDYDREHFKIYLQLLDASAVGSDWRNVVAELFEIDPEQEPLRVRKIYEGHLARAHWMTTTGYRQLAQ